MSILNSFGAATMNAENCQEFSETSSFLRRLSRDRSGNVMAIMTAFLIPMTALVGSAVDMSRTFVAKTRLQQACDAGALAGRKSLTASSGTQLDSAALTQANAFFQNNFSTGWMGTTGVTFTPVRTTEGQVSATATATVPMTVMKMFGSDSASTTVNCTARYDLPDLDVMFVLDNTGSMAYKADDSCPSSGAESGAPNLTSYTRPDGTTGYRRKLCGESKIAGIRTGVLSFYDTIAANLSAGAKVRYGFVTYSSSVNTGLLLSSNQIVDSWTYPSRQVIGDENLGSSSWDDRTGISSSDCNATNPGLNYRVPATGYDVYGKADVRSYNSWSSANSGTCRLKKQTVTVKWQYTNVSLDTSQYKLGGTVDDPSKITAVTSKWQGCLEERGNAAPASTFDINNLPPDLDPDLPATDANSKWRPMWPDVIYFRDNYTSIDYAGDPTNPNTNPYGDTLSTTNQGIYTNMIAPHNVDNEKFTCGKPATRLSEMTRSQVNSYLNASDFVAYGTTYHDTGMIWGTRLISPTGLFAADTAAWNGRPPPNRFIIFMTDGDINTQMDDYGLYGMEKYANRVKGGLSTSLNTLHGRRFVAECGAAKARGIKVYVIGYGQSLTSDMTSCASPGSAHQAPTDGDLQTIFETIARDIAALRLSQ